MKVRISPSLISRPAVLRGVGAEFEEGMERIIREARS